MRRGASQSQRLKMTRKDQGGGWRVFFSFSTLFFPEVLEHAGGKSGLENKGEEEENLEPGGLGDQVGGAGPQPTGDQPSEIFIRAEKNWLAKGDEGRASFCCLN